MSNQNEEKNFSLEERLKEWLGEYCENMPPERKEKFTSRISHDNEYFEEKMSYDENRPHLYDEKSPEHIRREKILNELLTDFRSSDSAVGRDLDKLLKHCDFKFRIINDSELERSGPGGSSSPNGIGRFNRGEDGKIDKAVIFIHASTFNKKHIDKLPGLLAHELGHLLDFNKRPKGYHGMIDGQETFADITGQIMAEKAGYQSLPWLKYMGDHVRKEQSEGRSGQVDGSPMGDFREETVTLYEKENNPTYTKDVKDLASYKSFTKLEKLRGTNAPTLNNTEQRNNFVNNAKQSQISYPPTGHDR